MASQYNKLIDDMQRVAKTTAEVADVVSGLTDAVWRMRREMDEMADAVGTMQGKLEGEIRRGQRAEQRVAVLEAQAGVNCGALQNLLIDDADGAARSDPSKAAVLLAQFEQFRRMYPGGDVMNLFRMTFGSDLVAGFVEAVNRHLYNPAFFETCCGLGRDASEVSA